MRRWVALFVLIVMAGCASVPAPVAVAAASAVTSSSGSERLGKVLAKYRDIAAHGGWASIPGGPKLALGSQGERVVLLRQRLSSTGDLKQDLKNPLFDEDLSEALRHFQERHGLEPDGAAGKETLAALNVPVEARIHQVEVNISRLQELETGLEDRYVAVNIPDFGLEVIEKGHPVMKMRVIVGQRREWQTPLLASKIQYLILNPKWHVPLEIMKKEVIHHLRKEPGYIAHENMKVYSDAGEVDPATIDWSKVDPKSGQYRLVQRSGPGNSLGRIKFMFPNPYDVYLHDTPSKNLFRRPMRALSHGCVRVENPLDLAEYLMKGQVDWSRERITSAIAKGKEQTVPLPETVPVHMIYLTAWVDGDGNTQFRNDLYGRD